MFDVEQKKPRSEKVSRHCKKKKEHSKLFKVDGKKNKWSSHTRIAGEFSITRSLYQLYNDIYGCIKPIRVGVGIVVILT